MTREDAIEIIRKNMPSDKSLPVYEALKTLVPELVESDDEKIREEMIRYFTEMKKGGSAALPYDDCIAYLEKQKEEEGYEAIPVESTLEYKLGFNAGKETRWSPTKEQVNALETTVRLSNFGCDKERRKILLSLLEQLKQSEEKQKEQKPADDKAFEEWIDDWWKHNKVNNPDSYDKGDEIQFDERSFKNFCRGIRNMYQQEPAWSEEDEDKLEQCIRIVSGWEGDYDIVKSPYSNFLKSLRPQPKQEWSKEVSENVDKANEEELTEFEQEVSDMVEYCKEHGEHVVFDYAKRHARTLLALAKKELLSHADESNPKIKVMTNLKRTYFSNPDKLPKWLKDDIAIKELNAHTKGYTNGYKDATKFYNDSVVYRNPEPVLPGVAYKPPRITDVLITPNTTCGTSTATLHGNTSATDGKEHNPSFTD